MEVLVLIVFVLFICWEIFKYLEGPTKPVPVKRQQKFKQQRFITSRVLNGSVEVHDSKQMMAILVLSERARAVN